MQLANPPKAEFEQTTYVGMLHQGVLAPAFFAAATLQLFRAQSHLWVPAIWIETAFFMLLPFGMLWLVSRWLVNDDRREHSSSLIYVAQFGAMLVAALVIVWQLVSRNMGLGDSNEIIALLVIQQVGWYFGVFSKVRGLEKTSLVLSGSTVFFVCCLSSSIEILIVAALFTVVSLWWLMGFYWGKLNDKAIDGTSKVLPVQRSALVVVLLLIGTLVGFCTLYSSSPRTFSVQGFMPFSGGERGSGDDFAREGIGDGHELTDGKDAEAVGPVDSDNFVEDDKPSLYDVISEQYDGPVFKKPPSRAVPLSEIAKHLHEVKESEATGRKFRTMRESKVRPDSELEEKISNALFCIEGNLPCRFAIDTFQQFDGVDWTKATTNDPSEFLPSIKLQKEDAGKPIFYVTQFLPDYLQERERFRIKILRLKSAVIPSPAFLNRWHISKVEQLHLFEWNDAGLLKLKGDPIPSHTVIDLESSVPNLSLLRHMEYSAPRSRSNLLQLPESKSKKRIEELAKEWTQGIKPGWQQVEAIVGHMRSDFELNQNWVVDETVHDTVEQFLAQKSGPDYMFATTCCLVLRAAGYKSRLASGFLVRESDFDLKSNHAHVTPDNLHMWPEVRLTGRQWIPVEPTPGCPIPFQKTTWLTWTVGILNSAIGWINHHLWQSVLLVLSLALVGWYRIELASLASWLWWCFVCLFWSKGLLTATRQLLDFRFRLAGATRPRSVTINEWCKNVDPNLSSDFFDTWNAKNFCAEATEIPRQQLVTRCSEPVRLLTLDKIRQFVVTNKRKEQE